MENAINWHRVVFWASLGVAVVFIAAKQLRPEKPLITIFEPQGRELVREYATRHFGWPPPVRRTSYAPVATPVSTRVHAR